MQPTAIVMLATNIENTRKQFVDHGGSLSVKMGTRVKLIYMFLTFVISFVHREVGKTNFATFHAQKVIDMKLEGEFKFFLY